MNGEAHDTFLSHTKVLYLLNERGEALSRSKLYKIKAKDIEGAHYEKFDLGVQKVLVFPGCCATRPRG
jgi:hypothetical protein